MTEQIIDCIFKAERSDSELHRLVADIRRASRLSGDSDIVAEYEHALAEFFGVRHAIAVSSGTAALHASLVETIRPGDEVLLPVIGVPMTATAIIEAGGVPVFYDCAPSSFAPDVESLHRYYSSKTRAIITVPMWGYPGICESTLTFARDRCLILIEDTAQALGTKSALGFEGTIGDIGCFSTHEFKLMSTGEGGFILTNDSNTEEKIRQFIRIGFSLSPAGFGHRSGLNYKLPAPQASLGLSQLEILDAKMSSRRIKAQVWRSSIGVGEPGSVIKDFYEPAFHHNGYSLALRIVDAAQAEARAFSQALFEVGVNTDIHRYRQSYLVDFPMLKGFYVDERYSGNLREDFPNASRVIDSLLVLPLHEQVQTTAIKAASEKLLNLLATV